MNATVEYLQEALMVVTDKLQHRDSVIADLSEQVELLTKERNIAVRKLNALSDINALENLYQAGLGQEYEITELTKERDLWIARHDYSAKRRKDFYDEHEKLKYAAKLALDALDEATTYTSSPSWSPSITDECKSASAALRQVGVQ